MAHGGEDDFIEEQVEEDEMDRESDFEEDTIPKIDPSSSDEHSENDELSIITLQPLDMTFLSREVEGGVSTGSDNRDMSPSSSSAPTSSILPSSAYSDLPPWVLQIQRWQCVVQECTPTHKNSVQEYM